MINPVMPIMTSFQIGLIFTTCYVIAGSARQSTISPRYWEETQPAAIEFCVPKPIIKMINKLSQGEMTCVQKSK